MAKEVIMVNVFCSDTTSTPYWRLSDTTAGSSWYYNNGSYGTLPIPRQKKNPFLLRPIVALRLFFNDRPKQKIESFKRTSQLTISRV